MPENNEPAIVEEETTAAAEPTVVKNFFQLRFAIFSRFFEMLLSLFKK